MRSSCALAITGVGVFITLEATGQTPCPDLPTGMIGSLVATNLGPVGSVGFLLFASEGRLTILEGYTVLDAWPEGVESATLIPG